MANYVKNELKLTGLLDESKIVTPEVDEILYWNPNASWILDKETLYINSIKYNASTLVSGKKLRVIKKASFDDTLITWPNQLLCPLKETV